MSARPGRWVAAIVGLAGLLSVGAALAAVSVRAELERTRITLGETSALVVIVVGAGGGVSEPQVSLPAGVSILGTSRAESFSWINGRSTTQIVFRLELGCQSPGTFRVGPVRVRVAGQWYESPGADLTVTPARVQLGTEGKGPASLGVDMTPRDPYVGQPVTLRVRLVQRATLVEDPEYTPPATPGFWSEKSSPPESYYADERGSRVLVTETRTRMYPLAAGTARVGEARVALTLALPLSGTDPFAWFSGGGPRRRLAIQSPPIDVRVRPLPLGAPPGFDGAVGHFSASWRADRDRTTQDVPVTVRLDVRGDGNLPLVRVSDLTIPGAEVFTGSVQDSFGPPGSTGAGRRRIQWTVLPRRSGTLSLPPPAFGWFDPKEGRYRTLEAVALEARVDPPLRTAAPEESEFPPMFADHPLDPFAHTALPWGFAAAGVCLGLGLKSLRAARVGIRKAAPTPAWFDGLRHGRGVSFWAAVERACGTLSARGEDVSAWRRQAEAARYGGASVPEDPVRAALLERLASRPKGKSLRAFGLAAVAILAAFALGVVSAPRGGDPKSAGDCLRADGWARSGDLARAVSEWTSLWERGSRRPALAARIAWAKMRDGATAEASLWVLKGDTGEPRDAALRWVTGQVRDAGGLQGFMPARLPVRSFEWALAAFLCGVCVAWAGRRTSVVLSAAALAVSAVPVLDAWRAASAQRAIVAQTVALEGQGVELVPGQVVAARQDGGSRVRVDVGSGLSGWVPARALWWPGDRR